MTVSTEAEDRFPRCRRLFHEDASAPGGKLRLLSIAFRTLGGDIGVSVSLTPIAPGGWMTFTPHPELGGFPTHTFDVIHKEHYYFKSATGRQSRECELTLQFRTVPGQTVATVKDEAGQTMAEYAVVLGVITIAVVVTLGLLSTAIKSTLSNVIASL